MALWALRIVFGIYFVAVGIAHYIVPDNLPSPMSWMYELSSGMHNASGTLEIFGGLGLIVPGLLKIQTRLTPLAATGLALVMLAAAIWHVQRSDLANVPLTLVIGGMMGFIAYGRWRLIPLIQD